MSQHCVSGYHTTLYFLSLPHPFIIFNVTQIFKLCCVIPKMLRSLFVFNPCPYYFLRTLRKAFISRSSGEKSLCDSIPWPLFSILQIIALTQSLVGCVLSVLLEVRLLMFFHTLPSFICKSGSSLSNSLSLYMCSYWSHLELQIFTGLTGTGA